MVKSVRNSTKQKKGLVLTKEVLLVLTGLRKTPKREREREKRREREIERMRERDDDNSPIYYMKR